MYLIDNDGDRWDSLGNGKLWRLAPTGQYRSRLHPTSCIREYHGPLSFYYDDGSEAPDPDRAQEGPSGNDWQEGQFIPGERVTTSSGRPATVVSGPYKTRAEDDVTVSWLVQTDDGVHALRRQLAPLDSRLSAVARVLRGSDAADTGTDLAAEVLRVLDAMPSVASPEACAIYIDRDGATWTRQSNGRYKLAHTSETQTLENLRSFYGPLTAVAE